MQTPATLLTMLLLTAAPLLIGCRLHLNSSTNLLDAQSLPALDDEPKSYIASEPSVTNGHDRRHWPTQSISIAVNQTEHHPTYTSEVLFSRRTARQRGEYPTAKNALEVESHSIAGALESPVNIVHAGFLLFAAPLRMLALQQWPWTVERGIDESFARLPHLQLDDPWRWIVISDDAIRPTLPDADSR